MNMNCTSMQLNLYGCSQATTGHVLSFNSSTVIPQILCQPMFLYVVIFTTKCVSYGKATVTIHSSKYRTIAN